MNPENRIEELTEKYIDELLTEEESQELNHLLQTSSEARQVFLSQTHFNSLINDSLNQKEPESNIEMIPNNIAPHTNLRNRILTLAACVILGFFLNTIISPSYSDSINDTSSHFIAQVTHASDVSNETLKKGRYLQNSFLTLEKGVTELSFFNGAQLTIQGPAQVKLHSLDEVDLKNGLISAVIPDSASGFKILTSGGAIQSSVSKFGVNASIKGEVETHVFEGFVHVLKSNGKLLASASQHEALRIVAGGANPIAIASNTFPGMRGNSDNLIPSGNFEQDVLIASDKFPKKFLQWSGDLARTVGEEQEIHPYEGKGMLRFDKSHNDSTPVEAKYLNSSSQVFCFIDLKESFPNGIPEGSQLVATCRVNRVTGNEQTDNRFNLRLSVLKELPEGPEDTIETHYDSTASKSIDSDSDPASWETLSVMLEAQPNAKYVSLEISALENIHNGIEDTVELDGHYLDDLKLTLLKPPTPAPVLVTSL